MGCIGSSLVGHMNRERKGFEGCPCLALANHTLWAGSRIDCPAQAFYLTLSHLEQQESH